MPLARQRNSLCGTVLREMHTPDGDLPCQEAEQFPKTGTNPLEANMKKSIVRPIIIRLAAPLALISIAACDVTSTGGYRVPVAISFS